MSRSAKVATTVVATSGVTLTGVDRIVRTVKQLLVAAAPDIPVLVGIFHIPAIEASKITGVVAAGVLVVSAVQNVLEELGVIPTSGGKVTGS